LSGTTLDQSDRPRVRSVAPARAHVPTAVSASKCAPQPSRATTGARRRLPARPASASAVSLQGGARVAM